MDRGSLFALALTALPPGRRSRTGTGWLRDTRTRDGTEHLETSTVVVSRGGLRQFNQFNDLPKSGTINVPT